MYDINVFTTVRSAGESKSILTNCVSFAMGYRPTYKKTITKSRFRDAMKGYQRVWCAMGYQYNLFTYVVWFPNAKSTDFDHWVYDNRMRWRRSRTMTKVSFGEWDSHNIMNIIISIQFRH